MTSTGVSLRASGVSGMYAIQQCASDLWQLVLATPTHIGAACSPWPCVPSQCKEKHIGYDFGGHDLQASRNASPYCTPAPYSGTSPGSMLFQCKSTGFCLRAATNHAQIGSMNSNVIFAMPLGISKAETSMSTVCITWFQNHGTLRIRVNNALLLLGNIFQASDLGVRKMLRAACRAASIATPAQLCNDRKNIQN